MLKELVLRDLVVGGKLVCHDGLLYVAKWLIVTRGFVGLANTSAVFTTNDFPEIRLVRSATVAVVDVVTHSSNVHLVAADFAVNRTADAGGGLH